MNRELGARPWAAFCEMAAASFSETCCKVRILMVKNFSKQKYAAPATALAMMFTWVLLEMICCTAVEEKQGPVPSGDGAVTQMAAFRKRMGAVISSAESQWQGRTIITFMDGERGGQAAFLKTLSDFSNLVYFVSAFGEEDSRILGLVNKIKGLSGLEFDEAVRRGDDAFEEYYNFAFGSLKRMLHKYSLRQIQEGFRNTAFKDIIAPGYGRFNKFLRALGGSLYTQTDEIDKSTLFISHMGGFMESVTERYRKFDTRVDKAVRQFLVFSG